MNSIFSLSMIDSKLTGKVEQDVIEMAKQSLEEEAGIQPPSE